LTLAISIRAKPTRPLFRIGYDTGREKWIAIDNQGVSDLGIEEMKEKIEDSEKGRKTGQISTIWYMGELVLLKL
jgi:hypothetical protein